MTILFAENLRSAGIPHGFTTRVGGASSGHLALGLDPARQVEAHQVHGAVVAVVGAGDGGHSVPDSDGLASIDPGTVLTIHAADCVPALLADPKRGAVAALHAGWRGVAAGIPIEGVRVMADHFHSRPEDLFAALGPAIGPCHYEVDEPVIARMRRWPWWEDVAVPNAHGRWQLDLRAACRRQLIDSGVPPERIEILDFCTYERPDLFYSFRRDGRTGPMGAIIAVPS